jgi:uncharacterized protein (DUF2141 family)
MARPGIVILVLAAALARQAPLSAAGGEGQLKAVVEKVGPQGGQLICLLFGAADGWPNDRRLARKEVTMVASKGELTCDFGPQPEGTYAVSVLHDQNTNGKMDRNLLGIPREGWGVSNNVKPTMRKPHFDECKFDLKGDRTISIVLRY